MMTLDEAILHCAERSGCTECGQEHEQLREWLEQLAAYKETGLEPREIVGSNFIRLPVPFKSKVYILNGDRNGYYECVVDSIITVRPGKSALMTAYAFVNGAKAEFLVCEENLGVDVFLSETDLPKAIDH